MDSKSIAIEAVKVFVDANSMTASQLAKSHGLRSLAQVSELTGASPQTLNNWHNHKPQLFRVVLMGCAEIQKNAPR
jgi:hypothetical protein